MTEYVSELIRDQIMEQIINYPENNTCFDCGSKNPTWASAYLGVLICFECAGRHRGYGTHISFIRSVNLDRWNKKQLKSMEITGNKFAREAFNELGIQKITGIYDYDSPSLQKYKNELGNKVIELLEIENPKKPQIEHNNITSKTNTQIGVSEVNNDLSKINLNVNKPDEKKEEVKFTDFKIDEKENSKNKKPEQKISKTSKIKKVDFDFDFDSFDEINFSNFENNKTSANSEIKSIKDESKEDPFSSFEDNRIEKENNTNNNNNYYRNDKDSEKIRQEADKKFANKKAISSEDYARLSENSEDNSTVKNKLNNLKNQQAISSSDLYGGNDYGSKLKDYAWGFTVKAAEKAKELKDKTSNLISKIQKKYGQ